MNTSMTKNVMIDIETFGPRPNGLIVSIGAVVFSTDPDDIRDNRIFSGKKEEQFHSLLNEKCAETESRFVKDPKVMHWWQVDQAPAYAKLMEGMSRSPYDSEEFIGAFVTWLKPFCDEGHNIIGNAPSFDLVIIENACKVTGHSFPVPYRAETDYRTITDLIYGSNAKPRPGPNEGHDALFDAKFQASTYATAMGMFSNMLRLAAMTEF